MKTKMKLNTKYFRTGGYSVLVSVIAIAIIIILNVFVNKLPATFTQFDMSAGNILSIGEDTISLVKGLEDDITVYYVSQHGKEDTYITSLLEKYKELSDKIKVEQIDPALNPGFFTGDRQNMKEGSLVVESEKRSKIITSFEIYYPGYTEEDLYSYYIQYQTTPSATGFDLENCMTSALNYVTTDVLPIVYSLTGHGEMGLSDTYKKYLSTESIELEELNLATLEAVPEDCDCLLISVPEKDISADEAERILNYLKAGGKMVYISYYGYSLETAHTNLDSVMDYYGMKKVEGVAVEGDSKASISSLSPIFFLPQYGTHEITTPLSGYNMILGYAQGVEKTEDIRDSVTVTPLLSTTEKSYSKVKLESDTIEKEDGDIPGPLDIAVAITETNEDGSETQIVWVNTPTFVDESMDYYGTGKAMFVNTFGWVCEKQESIDIPAKVFEQSYLELTEAQGNFLSAVFTIVIPVFVIVLGFVVWFRRRSK